MSAICTGLLAEALSPDAMFLALDRAARAAAAAGVSQSEYERVQTIILRHWQARRAGNPLSKLFV
ncbi:MAG: hypothetical protein ACYDH9_25595 [Limisphaerales bacterium]